MKKKIQKIFSKITVLVLLVAMLTPYISIPKVEAETEKTCEGGEWEYHTNYYFFLQAEHPHTWVNNLARDYDGIEGADMKFTTRYFTSFLYNFPIDGSTIDFDEKNSGFVKITDSKATPKKNFDAGKNRETWTAAQFYYEMDERVKSMTSEFEGDLSSYVYTMGEGTSEDDRIVTYLFHGDWAHIDTSSKPESFTWDLMKNLNISSGNVGFDHIDDQVDASILINKNDASITQAKIGTATFDNELELKMDYILAAIEDYNEGNRDANSHITNGKIKNDDDTYTDIGQPVVKMIIERNYETKDIFTTNPPTTLIEENGIHKATYTGNDYELNTRANDKIAEIQVNETLSYIDNNGTKQNVSDLVAIEGDDNGVWFIAPTLYQLSYKVCNTGGTSTDEVTLTYHGNEKSVNTTKIATGVPEKQVEKKGTEFTISDKEPSLEGYDFKYWNLSENCDSTKYEAGAKLGKLENDTPLYACWGDTSEGNNGDTGVLTYTGLFAGIIALAGGSYYLIKKKNLFKKI